MLDITQHTLQDTTSKTNSFKQRLRYELLRQTINSQAIFIAKNANVYTSGDQDKMVYLIESGQIKRLMLSHKGKECMLAIHTEGDIFGELCLSESGTRRETARAMENTILKQIPCASLLAQLSKSLLIGFVENLAMRLADQQQTITNLITIDSEQRLGETLLQLAQTLGTKDPLSIRIELKISHQELSQMVGTTRPRITLFMQRFRNLGLIEIDEKHFLIIKKKLLMDYLLQLP